MSANFETASRMKLRFSTNKGLLSVEDLWDMSLTSLNSLAKSLNRFIKESEEEDFLGEPSKESETDRLKFNIVLHVLKTKKNEKKQKELAKENNDKLNRLFDVLQRKREQNLENLSEEEIVNKIKELQGK